MKAPITLSKLPGCYNHEHADWNIGPCGQTRDSDTIEESNFRVAVASLAAIDPDEQDHEVHRFGHWACGWIEEIATRPGSPCDVLANELRESIDSYPILNEHDHSQLECDLEAENFPSIMRDLKRDLLAEFKSRIDPEDTEAMPADDLEEWLDTLDDEKIYSLARDYGEASEGWISWSKRDVETIADKIVASDW